MNNMSKTLLFMLLAGFTASLPTFAIPNTSSAPLQQVATKSQKLKALLAGLGANDSQDDPRIAALHNQTLEETPYMVVRKEQGRRSSQAWGDYQAILGDGASIFNHFKLSNLNNDELAEQLLHLIWQYTE